MGGGGGWVGAPSQEANRCSPSGVSQVADIKKRSGKKDKKIQSLIYGDTKSEEIIS